jgi:hypothetical protein
MTSQAAQVQRDHYFQTGYLHPHRFASYGYQFNELVDRNCESVVEVGVGAGILKFLLHRAGIDVKTLDIDESLDPDVVGSVTDIPLSTNFADAVVAFQVLEHLRYDEFAPALREMTRVARSFVMLSVPDVSRWYRFDNWIPFIGRVRFQIRLPRLNPPVHEFDGQHHWEIGKKDYPFSRIENTIQSCNLHIDSTYRPWEYGYHRFFILSLD